MSMGERVDFSCDTAGCCVLDCKAANAEIHVPLLASKAYGKQTAKISLFNFSWGNILFPMFPAFDTLPEVNNGLPVEFLP